MRPWPVAGLVLAAVIVVGAGVALLTRSGGGQQVDVDLTEWRVSPSVTEVPAGRVTFAAHNRSGDMVHELAILAVGPGDNRDALAEIEDLEPGASGTATVKLSPGQYELACLIVPGEAGSTTDHYHQGMHTAFTVR